jgi:hypothetical protein
LPAAVAATAHGFTDAAACGFSPEASGVANQQALQRAVDQTGTIVVSRPGAYRLAGTVFLGSHTALVFGHGVVVQKVDEQGPFTHVLLNKGALTKTWDEEITVEGLHVLVNGLDVRRFLVYGLHGQVAFHYVRDLRVRRFRCLDLGRAQYGIHVCTFEDIVIEDVLIKGLKDGVHLGRGKRFTIRDGVFDTGDDAVALNAHDYSVGNPELGWIEDGLVTNCHDLANPDRQVGYFCRILAGAWRDWEPGLEVQQSDTVVSAGRLYRVQAQPDGTVYRSVTRPTHMQGAHVLDGINWGVVQDDVTYTCGVRNVTFRDIWLAKPRVAFSIHFDNDKYSRSYYPGAPVPQQENLVFDNVRVLYDDPVPFLTIATPVNAVTIANAHLRRNGIRFTSNKAMRDYLPTQLSLVGCTFAHEGKLELVTNAVPGKRVALRTVGSTVLSNQFTAGVSAGAGAIAVTSDLPGLKP